MMALIRKAIKSLSRARSAETPMVMRERWPRGKEVKKKKKSNSCANICAKRRRRAAQTLSTFCSASTVGEAGGREEGGHRVCGQLVMET